MTLLSNLFYDPNLMRKPIKTGAIIFDETFRYLLIIRGSFSKKWGPPKGHLNLGENLIQGAFREVSEETGLFFNFPKYPYDLEILPRVVVENVRLFLVAVPYASRFEILDRNEISDIGWLDLYNSEVLLNLPMTKVLQKTVARLTYIRNLAQANLENYDFQVINDFQLNQSLASQVDRKQVSKDHLNLYHPHDVRKLIACL